jgi:hypothetical protein
MKKDTRWILIFFLFMLLGCVGTDSLSSPLPSPSGGNSVEVETLKSSTSPSSPLSTPEPTLHSLDYGRKHTALESLSVATDVAKSWNEDVELHAIFPSSLMGKNLGIPASPSGWFYMFRVPSSPVEFYVHILDKKVNGTTKAQAILGEELPYSYLPIQIERVEIDSDEALEILGKSESLDSLPPGNKVDYRLVHLEGQEHPVWTIFRVENGDLTPLIHVDAVNGVEKDDPFE